MIDQIKTKVSNNIRINDEEALYLYRDLDLLTLGKLAQEKRFKLVPNKSVSFVIDTNLNYTNILKQPTSKQAMKKKSKKWCLIM